MPVVLTNPIEEYKRLLHLRLRARFTGTPDEECYDDEMNVTWLRIMDGGHEHIDTYVEDVLHPLFTDGKLARLPPEYVPLIERYKHFQSAHLRARHAGDEALEESTLEEMYSLWYQMDVLTQNEASAFTGMLSKNHLDSSGNVLTLPPEYPLTAG